MIQYDIVVIGGGNVVFCVVMIVVKVGVKVFIFEFVFKFYCGGNFRYMCNFCCMYKGLFGLFVDDYSEEEYFEDLMKVIKGKIDEKFVCLVICKFEECLFWMEEYGVCF